VLREFHRKVYPPFARTTLMKLPASTASTWRALGSRQSEMQVLAEVLDLQRAPRTRGFADVGEQQSVSGLDFAAVLRIGEAQGQDAEGGQVLPLDPGEAHSQHQTDIQVPRHECRVLSARSLSAIGARNDGGALGAIGHGALIGARVEAAEQVAADLRDVAAQWQGLGAGGKDILGG
jgi:hypothetical protein